MGRLVVRFPDDRGVFVDGAPFGRTNQIREITNGTYDVDLGEPQDYAPPTREARVVTIGVREVVFTPVVAFAKKASKKKAAKKKATKKRAVGKKSRARKKAAKRKSSK
jgi:hypothetical protein